MATKLNNMLAWPYFKESEKYRIDMLYLIRRLGARDIYRSMKSVLKIPGARYNKLR